MHIFRITVRGRFDQVDDATRAALVDALPAHDLPGFSDVGELSYDRRVDFFSFRVQLREREGDHDGPEAAQAAAVARAEALAVERVDALGAGHRDLKAVATDMAEMWADRPRR